MFFETFWHFLSCEGSQGIYKYTTDIKRRLNTVTTTYPGDDDEGLPEILLLETDTVLLLVLLDDVFDRLQLATEELVTDGLSKNTDKITDFSSRLLLIFNQSLIFAGIVEFGEKTGALLPE